MKRIAIVALLAALSGCASPGNLHDPLRLKVAEIPPQKGILILSAGADKACDRTTNVTNVVIEHAGRTYPSGGSAIVILMDTAGRVDENYAGIEVDQRLTPSDFSDHYGTLSAITLDAGEYQFYPYVSLRTPVSVPRAYITVVAGKATYLGEAYLTQSCGLLTTMVFRDQSERDLKLLQTKNPALAAMPIEKKILQFSDHIFGEQPAKP